MQFHFNDDPSHGQTVGGTKVVRPLGTQPPVTRGKIVYFASEDWAFLSHFLPMARAARDMGLEVVVATRATGRGDRIVEEGFRLVPIEINRSSLSVFDAIRELASTFMIVRRERPDIVHCIALRQAFLSGIGAKLAGAKHLVLAPTGLGHLWIESGMGVWIARAVVRGIIGKVLRGARYVFENSDDPLEFGLDPTGSDVCVVGGAGVDPDQIEAAPEPLGLPIKVAVVARMIATKGIAESVDAVGRARAAGTPIELHLFGDRDTTNRRSVSAELLHQWTGTAGIYWHGHTDDVARVWREHHIALLLSYREGLPRTLVEAAAAGRPIVTTDTVGCREVVRDGIEGFLVPVRDIEHAARALVDLASDQALRVRMGAAARLRFTELFTEKAVARSIVNLYALLLFRSPGVERS